MKALLRCFADVRELWRAWALLLLVAVLSPPIVLAMPLIERQLIDGVVLAGQLDELVPTVAMYGGLWLLSTANQLARGVLRSYLSEQLTLRLRQRLFAHCETLSLAFSRSEHSGRTMSLFAHDVPNVANLFGTSLVNWLINLVGVVLAAVFMFSLSWHLAVVAAAAPVLAGVVTVVTRPLRPAARRAQEKLAELTESLQENLTGIREIVAFGQEQAQGQRFVTTMGELFKLRMRLTLMDTAFQAGQSVFSLAVSLIILGFGGYLVIHGQTTIGTLVAMRTLFGQLFYSAGQLSGLIGNMQKALGSADRLCAFLDQRPLVQERATARVPHHVAGAVTFDRVSFAYQPDRFVLHDISFTARPGEMIALVGPSGAGKSTLVSLIARFYDPTCGRVLLDGVDLRDLTLAGLRGQIGMVFQDTFLFATTIRENIAFGRTGASEDEIVAAARAANAWEFIERLPKGLDTMVGERGVRLSEGQKQRLAIARALLRDPRILILDEPTSALDARSEHLLQSALNNLMRGRTTFVIAHRLATVQQADRILVLDGGRVVEEGTHAELIQRHGLYWELFKLQFGSPEPLANDTLLTSSAAQN